MMGGGAGGAGGAGSSILMGGSSSRGGEISGRTSRGSETPSNSFVSGNDIVALPTSSSGNASEVG